MKTKMKLSIGSLLLLALLAIGCGSGSFDNGVSSNPSNLNSGQSDGSHGRPGGDNGYKVPPVR